MPRSTAEPAAPLDPDIIQTAAHWVATLQSGCAAVEDERACLRWRQAHPLHELAWTRMQGVGDALRRDAGTLSSEALRSSLGRARRGRRGLLSLLALAVAVPIALPIARRAGFGSDGTALHTGTAEQGRWTLEDGTQLVLAPRTTVGLDFDATQRLLVLRRGLIEVSSAPDPLGRRLSVQTPAGTVRALGTRFTVALDQANASVEVAVSSGAVELAPLAGEPKRIDAGRGARFDRFAVGPIAALAPDASAWVDGLLIADRMPLSEVLTRLGRYRRGHLGWEPAVADLRVTGSIPLASTDAALALLAETLPVRIESWVGLWTTVRAR